MLAPVQAGRQSSECPASGRPALTVWRTCPVCGDHLPGDRASTTIYCGRACKDTETYLAALERQVEEMAFASTTAGKRAVRRIHRRSVTRGELIPCSCCGESVPASATICPECGGNSSAETVSCWHCDGSGRIEVHLGGGPWNTTDARCPACEGDGVVEAPFITERDAAIAAGRAA
jgi:hypothetical protein